MLGRLSIATWLMVIGFALGAIGSVAFVWLSVTGQTASSSSAAALALLAGFALLALAVLAFVVGLALYVVLPALDPYKARQNYGSHRTVLACLALAITISLILQSAFLLASAFVVPASGGNNFATSLGTRTGQMLGPLGLVVGIVTLELALLAVLWVRVVRPGIITWTRMGLTGENLGRKILYGMATGITVFLAAAIVESIFAQFGLKQMQTELFSSIKGAPLPQFALVLLAGGPLAAFVEEAFFRGYVFQAYWEQKGTWRAYIFSSLIFAIVHLFTRNLLDFLPTFAGIFVIGLVLAYVYRKTNSVIPVMIGHGINNTVAFAALYWGTV